MAMDNLSLDIDELNSQAELESLMPAELVKCEYKDVNFTDDSGLASSRRIWQLEWDRLDRDMSGASGEKYLYRSSHNMPAAGQMRRSTLKKQVDCFAKVKLTGKNPEDFLGAKHWIREIVENAGSRYEKAWWRTEAIYVEGESYENAVNGVADTSNINAPITITSTVTDSQSEVDSSVYDLLVDTIKGKSVRQSLTALRNEEGIPEEMVDAFQSGTLQDELIDQGIIEDVDGKFVDRR